MKIVSEIALKPFGLFNVEVALLRIDFAQCVQHLFVYDPLLLVGVVTFKDVWHVIFKAICSPSQIGLSCERQNFDSRLTN